MGALSGLIAAAGAGTFAYIVFWARCRTRARWWREAVAAAGLAAVKSASFLGCTTRITGRAGSLHVTVSTYQRGRHEQGTRIRFGGFGHGAYDLSIRAEGVTSAIEKTFGEKELEIGDQAFDSAAYLQGSPALARAIFDRQTRRRMEALLRGELLVKVPGGARTLKVRSSLAGDVFQVDIPSRFFGSGDELTPAALVTLLDLARQLERPRDLAERIAGNLAGEPLADVRLACVRTLASEFPEHPATRGALRSGLVDGDVEVRLLSATALGAEGRGALIELATGAATDRVAAAAITALGDALPIDEAVERLRKARRVRQDATARACIDRVGRAGTAFGMAALAEVIEEDGHELAAAATRALGLAARDGGEPRVAETLERALVAALGHRSSEVRMAAAVALGRVGTPLAVAPLREATSGRALDGALRRATRQAIAEIQSRVTGASPGQLSLSDEGGGQLSLAEGDLGGQLSLDVSGARGSLGDRREAGRTSPQPGSGPAATLAPSPAPARDGVVGAPGEASGPGEAADTAADAAPDRADGAVGQPNGDHDAVRRRAQQAEAARNTGPIRGS